MNPPDKKILSLPEMPLFPPIDTTKPVYRPHMVGKIPVSTEAFTYVTSTLALDSQRSRIRARRTLIDPPILEKDRPIPAQQPEYTVDIRDCQIIVASCLFHTDEQTTKLPTTTLRLMGKNREGKRKLITERLPTEFEEEIRYFEGIRAVAWDMHQIVPGPSKTDELIVLLPLFRGKPTPQAWFALQMTQEQVNLLNNATLPQVEQN
jgi:hypothetical protein